MSRRHPTFQAGPPVRASTVQGGGHGLPRWVGWGLLLWLGGCRSFGATAYNLRVLHESNGALATRSATVAHWYYRWCDLLGSPPTPLAPAGSPRVLSRPRQRVFEASLELLEADPVEPARRGEQVSLAAFLCAFDRSTVVRERAVALLDRWARRLKLDRLPAAPALEPEPARTAGIEALRLRLGLAPPAADAPQPPLSSRELEALDLLGTLELLDGFDSRLVEPGWARSSAALDSQRVLLARCVGLALRTALEDPQDWVRAGAARAVFRFDPSQTFDVLSDALLRRQPETIAAACDYLSGAKERFEGHPRVDWFERLIAAVDFPEDRASVAAARALELASDGALFSLRPEDWLLWWELEAKQDPPLTSASPSLPIAPLVEADGDVP